MRSLSAKVLAVARRVLGSGGDAEDAAQDAFLAAWRGIAGFDGRSSLGTWLHRIALNAAIARLKARARRKEVAMQDGPADGAADLPSLGEADPAQRTELARKVWGAIEELGDVDRAVLVLRDVEEVSSKEVAEALGLTDATVRQRLHRARQVVAERLRPSLREDRKIVCGGRLDLLFDYIDESLEKELMTPVFEHLASCAKCRGFLGAYRQTIVAPRESADALESVDLPERRKRRVLEAARTLRPSSGAVM